MIEFIIFNHKIKNANKNEYFYNQFFYAKRKI